MGPEYVINEARAKTAKNNGELDRIIVEGKHQPIVTKEEFERVQRMLEEKNAQTAQRRKNKGVYSDDLWRRKLRCQCGHAFAKTRWHSKSRDFTTYTYKCYDQTRTGTVPVLCGYNSVVISFASVGGHLHKNMALQSEKPSR